MNNVDTVQDEDITHMRPLSQIFTWVAVVALLLSIVELTAYVFTRSVPLAIISGISFFFFLLALWGQRLIRRGKMSAAVLMMSATVLIVALITSIVFPTIAAVLVVACIMAVTFTLSFLNRRTVQWILVSGWIIGTLVTIPGRTTLFAPLFAPPPLWATDLVVVLGTTTLLAVTLLTYWQFTERLSTSLIQARDSNAALRQAQIALEAQQASLEAQVIERTAALQATVDQLRASQETIRVLGAPIIPVLPNVLVVPLIGTLDVTRMQHMQEQLLLEVHRQRARSVILDFTGIMLIDTEVAQALLQIISTIRLLGAAVLLVGIRPEIAQTLVALNVEFDAIHTYASLQAAVSVLARQHNAAQP